MLFWSFFVSYLTWHYTTALTGYVRVARNFSWFISNFFSIVILLRTLFAPLKRITEPRHKRFSLEDWFGSLVITLLSRCIGALIRLTIIVAGFATLVLYTTLAILGFGIWISAPILITCGVIVGILFIGIGIGI